jgi:hypothetical protein
MTRLSEAGSRPKFLPFACIATAPDPSRETAHVGLPRMIARGLAFGLEDRNDRKSGDTRGL